MYKTLSLKNKRIVVTGASSGIGFSTAKFLSDEGAKVTAVARREKNLKELQSYCPENIRFFAGDLNDPSFIEKLQSEDVFNTDVLINNAGLALGKDHFANVSNEQVDTMIQTNIASSFKIAHECLTLMQKNKCGDIINICSISSHEVYAGGAVYCATKHALLAFGKALRHETLGQNIRVMSVSPGMVDTEFSLVRFEGNKSKADEVYEKMTPLYAQDIAFQILHALKCPRHVNIDEILVMPTDQAGVANIIRTR